tara:strand:- start:1373 stop:1837 length:465 start_codon:yes stop_codon:yes gene_type:complete
MSEQMDQTKVDFVEEMTLKMEETGLPRIACQILSWLMICNPVHQSFSDLIENLKISKASISNMTRLLIQMGLIEKVRIQGERQIHFQLKNNAWVDLLEIQTQQIFSLARISKKGMILAESDENVDNARLEEMNRFYSFLADEMPSLINRYKKMS